MFDTEVVEAEFDTEANAWRIHTRDGRVFVADLLVSACGQLSRPAWPELPGLADFAGVSASVADELVSKLAGSAE
jgi:cation diffusion facilitator CzcD-associated flavoprotein CzcO